MKIQTISLCTGDGRCPRHCPYCVSRMTGKQDFSNMPEIISPKVLKAIQLARLSGVSTALLTSKGETLFGVGRDHAFQYLSLLNSFPFIEVQTSGYGLDDDTLKELEEHGVTTIAISCVSDSHTRNREIFGTDYEDPFEIADRIHARGMMVRLCCTMCAGYCESTETVDHMISSCRHKGIEQLSFVPVTAPDKSMSMKITKWASTCGLDVAEVKRLYDHVRKSGPKLMTLMHGGEVYDVDGVSVCIRYCLTDDPETNALRQVIVYPNGDTRYSWTHKAARLIRGD